MSSNSENRPYLRQTQSQVQSRNITVATTGLPLTGLRSMRRLSEGSIPAIPSFDGHSKEQPTSIPINTLLATTAATISTSATQTVTTVSSWPFATGTVSDSSCCLHSPTVSNSSSQRSEGPSPASTPASSTPSSPCSAPISPASSCSPSPTAASFKSSLHYQKEKKEPHCTYSISFEPLPPTKEIADRAQTVAEMVNGTDFDQTTTTTPRQMGAVSTTTLTTTALKSQPTELLDLPTEILQEILCRLVAPKNFVRSCRQIYNLSRSPSLRAKYLWLLHGPDQVLSRKTVELHKLTRSILDSPVVLLLIAMGAVYRDPEEFIFRWACSKGHVDVVCHLLENSEPGIDLRFRSDWFLREAAKNGCRDVVAILLQQPDYIPSESGLNKAFEAAYEQSHCSTVKALLDFAEARGAIVQQLEIEQRTAVSGPGTFPVSIFQSSIPSTRRARRVMAGGLFIQKDADKALRYAVRGNDVEMVKLLMEYEADVHAFNEEAILVAAQKGHVEILKLLIQAGANIETKNGAPLRQAAEAGHAEAVKVLCESGADTMLGGCSALRTATSQGYDNIIAILLDHGADVNIHEGTPLQLACQHGHEAAVRVLLQYGANHRLDDGAAYKMALDANHEGIKALLVQAEKTMRAKERELERMIQQQQQQEGGMMTQQQLQPLSIPPDSRVYTGNYGNFSPIPGISSSSMSSVPSAENARRHKRYYSQISNPLSVADLFRSGSVCGLVALDDEIRSRQRSESNRL